MTVVRGLGALAAVAGVVWSVPAMAQVGTGTISGHVTDSSSAAPLPSVTVSIPGTQRGALTRSDGSFTISGVPEGVVTLQARRIGYKVVQQRVTVPSGGTVTANLVLAASTLTLETVVSVGYGTQRREAITSAVSTINADEANKGVVPNVNSMIQGRAAGVNIITNSGDPGAGAQVTIRGGTSISASNDPLYVVDGVPIENSSAQPGGYGIGGSASLNRNPLNSLSPDDIANITVLKDASATAIYGSRGANGVILIETKKGNTGPGTMEYQGYVATATAANKLDVLSASQFSTYVKQQVAAGNLTNSALGSLGTANTNWQDALLRTAATQNHDLSFSGGSQDTRYRASLNYMDNEGIVINNGFKRYQGRVNGTTQGFDGRLRVGLNLTASQVQDQYLPYENSGGFEGGTFVNMVTYNPTQPVMVRDSVTGNSVFYELGPGAQSQRNPVALARQINDRGTTNRILGNVTGAYSLLPSLTASMNFGVDRQQGQRNTYIPAANPAGAAIGGGVAQDVLKNVGATTFQGLLTFDRQLFEKTSFNIVGGYEVASYTLNGFGAQSLQFISDVTGPNSLQSGGNPQPPFTLADSNHVLESFFSRVNLGFADRYFLTGVVRRDGSSVFGANNKWATFPAISASWRLSQESFLRDRIFSDLRLRAGYGVQGNQAVSPYQSLNLLGADPGSRYNFGSTLYTAVLPVQVANPDLKWEQTKQADVALDYGFDNQRFTGTVEYYSKNTSDLLLTVLVPQPAVVTSQIENIGRVKNAGLEASLEAVLLNQPGLSWSAGFTMSSDRNKVVSLGGQPYIESGFISGPGQSGAPSERIMPGYALGTFYGPVYAGVNSSHQQLFVHYVNGKASGTTTSPGDGDKVVLGNATPRYNLGIHSNGTWRRFDASFLVHAQGGFQVFNNTALVYATQSLAKQGKNFLASALSDGTDINQPAIYSSRFVENGRFVRLQNVTLGYTFGLPGASTRVRSARVYVSGDNLLLSTPYSGYDPEVYTVNGLATRGLDYLTYPRARTYTTGLSLAF